MTSPNNSRCACPPRTSLTVAEEKQILAQLANGIALAPRRCECRKVA